MEAGKRKAKSTAAGVGGGGVGGGEFNRKVLFSKKLTKSDVSGPIYLRDLYGDMLMAQQEKLGHLAITDLKTGKDWRFFLRLSKDGTPNRRYTFDKLGWLEFVQSKDLSDGDCVVFERDLKYPSHFYIYCVFVKTQIPADSSGKSGMMQMIKSLEQAGHVAAAMPNESGKSLKSLFTLINTGEVSGECVDCLLCLSLFPKGYEIERDTIIQLWMANGFLKELATWDAVEYVGVAYFDALEFKGYVSFSREELGTGKRWYKVNDFTLSQEMSTRIAHLRVGDDGDDPPVKTTRPRHVTVRRLPASANSIKEVERFAEMRTLWFLHHHESTLKRLPYSFFNSLNQLQVLNLSETKLSELPSSIANLKALHYLDLSKTLITQLPNTIVDLKQLHTLKLQNCPRLVSLPKHTSRLTTLRHLDFGTHCHLHSMPPGMGMLTSLRMLSEFIVSPTYNSCSLAELKNLSNLEGNFCLSGLQHTSSSMLMEAMDANLSKKPLLRKLELRWNPGQRGDNVSVDIIGYMQPHTNLKHLKIHNYGGSVFPSWISDPAFKNLVSITLFKCENCSSLPTLGQLPSLESLCLNGSTAIRSIGSRFCVDSSDDNDYVAFPKLQNLAIMSMLELQEWTGVGKCHFPSLLKLTIKDCPRLVTLCRLSNIHSLQHLEISDCTLLPSLPEGCLPASLENLVIEDCPLLKSSCSKPQDWHKMDHVPSVWIDYERIT